LLNVFKGLQMTMKKSVKNDCKVVWVNLASNKWEVQILTLGHWTHGCGREQCDWKWNYDHISHSVPVQCVDTLLDYIGQWGFE
jgi:hypothetical protein